MKTYLITIKPTSGFGTPIKGDTLFGQLCWQIYYDNILFGKNLSELLSDYDKNPFIVISSAYPKIKDVVALKRPDLPIELLFSFNNLPKEQIIKQRKYYKEKKWFLISLNQKKSSIKEDGLYCNDEELFEKFINNVDLDVQRFFKKVGIKSIILDFEQMHNTINRLSGKTGEGRFAPYSVEQKVYVPELELAIFVGLREDIKIEMVNKAFERIGNIGYGKDASTGLGKFQVENYIEIDLGFFFGKDGVNGCYTLSPSVSDSNDYRKIYFSPFIRFGRHGDILARSGKPFKNPVIMADEGAVYLFNDKNILDKPYLGKAVTGLSKILIETVHQGYSLYIPIKVEE